MKIVRGSTILKDSSTEKKHVFLSLLLKMLSCKKRQMREGGSVMSFVNIRLNFENKSTLPGWMQPSHKQLAPTIQPFWFHLAQQLNSQLCLLPTRCTIYSQLGQNLIQTSSASLELVGELEEAGVEAGAGVDARPQETFQLNLTCKTHNYHIDT